MTDDTLRAALSHLNKLRPSGVHVERAAAVLEAALEEHVPVQYDTGCDYHKGRTDRHCARCGIEMPALAASATDEPTELDKNRGPQTPDRCTECGVPFASHPLTDACAIAQESRDAEALEPRQNHCPGCDGNHA